MYDKKKKKICLHENVLNMTFKPNLTIHTVFLHHEIQNQRKGMYRFSTYSLFVEAYMSNIYPAGLVEQFSYWKLHSSIKCTSVPPSKLRGLTKSHFPLSPSDRRRE